MLADISAGANQRAAERDDTFVSGTTTTAVRSTTTSRRVDSNHHQLGFRLTCAPLHQSCTTSIPAQETVSEKNTKLRNWANSTNVPEIVLKKRRMKSKHYRSTERGLALI